jgi:hypothetical protein
MSYIGNTPTNQNFVAGSDQFNGTGSQTVFTLSRNVNTVNDIQVVVSNVPQDPFTAYSVAGNSLTFTSAPPAGTGNVYVVYRATNVQTFLPALGAIGKAQLDVANFNGTGAVSIPAGTTAQRPGAPVAGMIRFNTTNSEYEVYDSGSWRALTDQPVGYSADYLVVAGGGSGAEGGGGAGGFLASTGIFVSSTAYSVVIGAGGAGSTWSTSFGASGADSSLVTSSGTQTAIGGARGGNTNGIVNGGSGGGGRRDGSNKGSAGFFGQGHGGGTSPADSAGYEGGGGGGGAGGAGQSGGNWNHPTSGAGSEFAGAGGPGLYWYNGTAYAGGGGGGTENGATNSGVAQGGIGGGGNGNEGSTTAPTSGSANTGGGGGGLGSNTAFSSGSGGSGIVIIRYAGAQRGTGGTVTSSGGYTYHTFTTSGTYTA